MRAIEQSGITARMPSAFHQVHEVDDWISAAGIVGLGGLVTAGLAVLVALPFALVGQALSGAHRARVEVAGWAFVTAPGIYVMVEAQGLHTFAQQFVLVQWTAYATALWAVAQLLVDHPHRLERLGEWLFRGGLGWLGLCSLAWASSMVGPSHNVRRPAPHTNAPHVLLISIDSLRADHLGTYGYHRDTSPRLDQLARDGVRFETVVSSTSWTLPAHMSLLTALPSEYHGVTQNGRRAGREALFLAEVFRDAGYATAGFAGGPYLDSGYGFYQGFDLYDDWSVMKSTHAGAHVGVTSPELVHGALGWVDERDQARPFFLFLHLWDVHYDYSPPAPFDTWFDPDYQGTVSSKDFERSADIHPGMDRRDLEHLVALYDGEIRFVDDWVGKLLDGLANRGLLDNTMVVVTSDHGEEFFEHHNKGHQKTLYDEVLLVPLIMRLPERIPPGTTIPGVVRLIDVAPTVLSLAGVARPPAFGRPDLPNASQDLTPLLVDPDRPRPLATSLLFDDYASIRTADWKWIEETTERGTTELFDLRADPAEARSVHAERPDVARDLADALDSYRAVWTTGSVSTQAEADASVTEHLRQLGYVE